MADTFTMDGASRPVPSPAALAEARLEAEAAIERLITLLDRIDGEADLEDAPEADTDREPDDDGEPSYGWTETEARWGRYDTTSVMFTGGEGECCLGWTVGINQAARDWCGSTNDNEAEHDGREPEFH